MRVAIITMFHNSSNYGGIVQAYALTRILNKNGYESEQISYNHYSAYPIKRQLLIKTVKYRRLIKNPKSLSLFRGISSRSREVIKSAKMLVPHSKRIYTEKTIHNCLIDYDAFITGSDQVWHGEWPAFFLSFVPSDKRKIAYAVSTGKGTLKTDDIEKIKESTRDFKAISVREEDTRRQLSDSIPGKDIQLVLDPTLILDSQDWEEICSDRLVVGGYLFCYFLGADVRMRRLATEYGRRHDLKVVTIPHMQGFVEWNDVGFGDIQSFFATPQDFLSLIKYAELVFTDSFHASVFSQIFKTQYVTFGRTEHKEMNNRLETLTQMFHTRNRFISEDEKFTIDYIESLESIDYSKESKEYLELKQKSINFLLDSLK